jgi:hypothetical protein
MCRLVTAGGALLQVLLLSFLIVFSQAFVVVPQCYHAVAPWSATKRLLCAGAASPNNNKITPRSWRAAATARLGVILHQQQRQQQHPPFSRLDASTGELPEESTDAPEDVMVSRFERFVRQTTGHDSYRFVVE